MAFGNATARHDVMLASIFLLISIAGSAVIAEPSTALGKSVSQKPTLAYRPEYNNLYFLVKRMLEISACDSFSNFVFLAHY